MQLFIPQKNEAFTVAEDIKLPTHGWRYQRQRRQEQEGAVNLPAGTEMKFSSFDAHSCGTDVKFQITGQGIIGIPVQHVNLIKFVDKVIDNSPPAFQHVYPIPENYHLAQTQIQYIDRFIREVNSQNSSWQWCYSHFRLSSDSAARLWRKGIFKRRYRNAAEYRLTMAGYRLYTLQGGTQRHNRLE